MLFAQRQVGTVEGRGFENSNRGIPQNRESHRKISATVNGKVYKTVFRPAIIYGAQEHELDVWSNENG